jgi:protein tyrosine/serine phosphatase
MQMMNRNDIATRREIFAVLPALVLFAGKAVAEMAPAAVRPAAWAQPIPLAGVPNLHQVEENFYRSAQPDAKGFRALAMQYGLKSVVSLRAFNSDAPLTRGLNLQLTRFPIHTWHIEREDVVGALRSLRLAMREGPVLLHCQHGADRTGLITALYRILYQGWSKQAAADEMLNGKFGYHAVWGNIPRYIARVDVARLRSEVGAP